MNVANLINKNYIILSAIYLSIDIGYLLVVQPYYENMIFTIQNRKMNARKVYGFVAYIILLLSIFYIGIPLMMLYKLQHPSTNNILISLYTMGLLGFTIYGVFDITNMYMFSQYSLIYALTDWLWGTFIFTILGYIYLLLDYPISK
jgi:uncharacterized membrane protein